MNVIKTSCQMKHVSEIPNLQSPQNVLFFKLFSAMILRFINALVKKIAQHRYVIHAIHLPYTNDIKSTFPPKMLC